jgi:hypothetical protein
MKPPRTKAGVVADLVLLAALVAYVVVVAVGVLA